MDIAWVIVALVVLVVAGAAAARRIGIPTPLLLVLVGVVLALLPFVPNIALNPEIVRMGPPLLYSAAFNTSWIDFRAKKGTIASLSIGLVLASTLVVGVVIWLVLPSIPLPAAIAVGAVVAPPDAVATTAIARRVGMPQSIVQILEGESLLNDATALTALRAALAALAGTLTVLEVGWDFLVAAGGGAVVGLVVALIYTPIAARITSTALATPLTFVAPYLAFLLAEEVDASGVVAVVVAGLYIGFQTPKSPSAENRLTARSNWHTIEFLLENVVFLLIGWQLTIILADVRDSDLSPGTIASLCLAAFAATVVVRFAWVMSGAALSRVKWPWGRSVPLPWADSLVISWAGMRGVVTLAAALLLPLDIAYRSVLILVAYVIVLASLLLEGMTLPWLVRRLGLPAPDPRRRALQQVALLERATAAGEAVLDDHVRADHSPQAIERVLSGLELRRNAAWERLALSRGHTETPVEAYVRLRRMMLEAERTAVITARDSGGFDDDAIHQVLRMLDVESAELFDTSASVTDADGDIVPTAGILRGCEHLQRAQETGAPAALTCQGCLTDGTDWVHLRMCLTCGYRGCCDSSVSRHARLHFESTGHPVIRSIEPGETWRWCFVDSELGGMVDAEDA